MQILLICERKLEQYLKRKYIRNSVLAKKKQDFFFIIRRNRLIQEYINSFKSFEDTLSKANEGIEFYKKVI